MSPVKIDLYFDKIMSTCRKYWSMQCFFRGIHMKIQSKYSSDHKQLNIYLCVLTKSTWVHVAVHAVAHTLPASWSTVHSLVCTCELCEMYMRKQFERKYYMHTYRLNRLSQARVHTYSHSRMHSYATRGQ